MPHLTQAKRGTYHLKILFAITVAIAITATAITIAIEIKLKLCAAIGAENGTLGDGGVAVLTIH